MGTLSTSPLFGRKKKCWVDPGRKGREGESENSALHCGGGRKRSSDKYLTAFPPPSPLHLKTGKKRKPFFPLLHLHRDESAPRSEKPAWATNGASPRRRRPANESPCVRQIFSLSPLVPKWLPPWPSSPSLPPLFSPNGGWRPRSPPDVVTAARRQIEGGGGEERVPSLLRSLEDGFPLVVFSNQTDRRAPPLSPPRLPRRRRRRRRRRRGRPWAFLGVFTQSERHGNTPRCQTLSPPRLVSVAESRGSNHQSTERVKTETL